MTVRTRWSLLSIATLLVSGGLAVPGAAYAQDHGDHAAHVMAPAARQAADPGVPREAGQATFAAISEIVRLLEADASTDWSRVNLDALREHLRDMDRVMLHADVAREELAGGVRLVVTGDGAVRDAIRRMLLAHAPVLESELPVRARVTHHDGGVVLEVAARDATDAALATRLRALGFAGLLATGAHHQSHHLAIARGVVGDAAHGHH